MNENQRKNLSVKIILILIVVVISGCATIPPPVPRCPEYPKSTEIFIGKWWNYYNRAMILMEKGCYESAVNDLDKAITRRFDDQRKARTHGHINDIDYFPHREKGIALFLLYNEAEEAEKELILSEAEKELMLSLEQFQTAKARYFLDVIRKIKMQAEPAAEPLIKITSPNFPDGKTEIWTDADPVIFSGIARDEKQFVAEIFLADKPVFMEATSKSVSFTEKLALAQGRHTIELKVRNLRGGVAIRRMTVHADRDGPVIILKKFKPGAEIEGRLYDASGAVSLYIDGRYNLIPPQKDVKFSVRLKPEQKIVTLSAKDKAGNVTQLEVNSELSAIPTSGTESGMLLKIRVRILKSLAITRKLSRLPMITFSPI
ncbi:tetratricopeptide repeat protein [Desulfococcaceae bacterium HSG9]|nr:tetratricopeptide repeat protein [Desulfococcaceae bacterium HSG9]